MGYRDYYRIDPLKAAFDAVTNQAEVNRRGDALRRLDLYQDNSYPHLRDWAWDIFKEPAVRARIDPFLKAAAASSIVKLVVDAIARPVYAVSPVRMVSDSRDQLALALLAEECRLNERMDLACRITQAANACLLYLRYLPRLGRVSIDVLAPHQVTVGPDPDDPSTELFVVYDRTMMIDGKQETVHVYWDDFETFTFRDNESRIPLEGGEYTKAHGLGRLPFVSMHRRERLCGSYWDQTTGNDLVGAQLLISLLTALAGKLHHSQGFKQLVITGDIMNFPKDQILDETNALLVPEGSSLEALDLNSDASNYTNTVASIASRVAAGYGLNEDRLNAKYGDMANDVGLLERRADMIKVVRRTEMDVFNVMRIVSREHHDPAFRISDGSTMVPDFGEIQARVDRMTLLSIREKERSMGLRSGVDDVMEDQPEVVTRDQAIEEIKRNMEAEAEIVKLRRALNIPEGATVENSGQDPAVNGAMGPMVRDGNMTRDEAASLAAGGAPKPKDLRKMALKVLRVA